MVHMATSSWVRGARCTTLQKVSMGAITRFFSEIGGLEG